MKPECSIVMSVSTYKATQFNPENIGIMVFGKNGDLLRDYAAP
jgi:hypothetical protein